MKGEFMTTNNALGNQLMRATLARFESQRESALATIGLYLNAASGIGDHPDVVTELQHATVKLAEAEEALDTLQRNFLAGPEESEND
tara:strand:+ start:229 stop:489 length:261 start_codon:yes stop_codon:yes gene_type:complete